MADPVITDHFRALWIWQGVSGLPEDRYVNSFAFRNDALAGDAAGRIAANLDAFYSDVHTPGTVSLASFIPDDMVLPTAEVRVYDLGSPAPREPTIVPVTVTGLGTQNPLPGEVALCLSYVASANQPRSRGRIYLGPLSTGAPGTVVAGHMTPVSTLVSALVGAGTFLASGTNDLTWTLISQADAASKIITGGWVDNAFDTQRRRGGEASTRTTFGTGT